MIKHIRHTLITMLVFLVSCGPNIPSTMLSDAFAIGLEQNTTDAVHYVFKSDLGEKHKTRGLRYRDDKGGNPTELRARPTFIDQTFSTIFADYMQRRFAKLDPASDLVLTVNLKEYTIKGPGDWKLRKKILRKGKLTYQVNLKRGDEVLYNKEIITEASVSYSMTVGKETALDYRNELTNEICNVTLAEIEQVLKSHNL